MWKTDILVPAPKELAWWRDMSYIRVCDRAAGCQDEVYTLCEEPGCGQGDQLSRGVQDGCPEEGTWHGVTVFHNLQGPFTTTASFAPHCSPVAELGPGLSLPFCALDSREHVLLEWALSVGHSPKAWEGGAKTRTVGEGRAGWSPRPVLPWIPTPASWEGSPRTKPAGVQMCFC